MLYLIFQILFFLLIAALLGFVIGWLLRGSRFQNELRDLDARWRSKLSEVEGERDRFVGEVTQANEARAQFEASAAEAQRLAETHESSLDQLRREHQTKLGLLAEVEQRAGSLENELAGRDRELADARTALAENQGSNADTDRLSRELAAATARSESLEGELRQAKEANGECRREVERLEARIAELQRSGAGASSGSALGLVSSTGSSTTSDDRNDGDTKRGGLAATGPSDVAAGSDANAGTGAGASTGEGAGTGGTLGLVGGTDTGAGSSGAGGPEAAGYTQRAASPNALAEDGGQRFTGAAQAGTSAGDDDEGVRPEALSEARGGSADDLKKISGVGPKLERTLNGLGIFHFSQIAAFTPENVTWVDRHLRFKGRIDRENWIEQAKILAAGGETEFSRRN